MPTNTAVVAAGAAPAIVNRTDHHNSASSHEGALFCVYKGVRNDEISQCT